MSWTISELADRCGLSVDTLRYYEREGLLPPQPRDSAGRRVYDEGVLDHLEVVLALRQGGFGVRQIADFLAGARGGDTVRDRLAAAERALAELDAVLSERAARLRRARRVLGAWRAQVAGARTQEDLDRRLPCSPPS